MKNLSEVAFISRLKIELNWKFIRLYVYIHVQDMWNISRYDIPSIVWQNWVNPQKRTVLYVCSYEPGI